jgi:hypothetical protein
MRAVLASLSSLLAAGLVVLTLATGVSAQPPVDAGATPLAADGGAPGDAAAEAALPPPPPPPPPEAVPPPPPPTTTVTETLSTPPPPPPRRDERLAPRDRHFLGAGLDLGVSGPLPDLGVMVAYEPFRFLRVAGGLDHNLIGFGVKGDLTLINPYYVPLSLTSEFGTFFETDANPTIRKFVKKQKEDVASLKKVGYDYLNLLLGFEGGSQMVRFYVRAGTSWVSAKASDFQQTLKAANVTVSKASDPKISYQGPAFKLGLFFFFP